eukprot:329070_1
MALVELNNQNILKYLISQNVDGLHRRSGFNPNCLSELHGNANLELCKACGKQYLRDYNVGNPSNNCDNHFTGRRCKNKIRKSKQICNGRLYDTIINFGDDLRDYAWKPAETNAEKADLCLVLGSSVTVSPAADLPEMVPKLCIVNLQKTPLDNLCDVRIHAKCDDAMQLLMKELGLQIPKWILKRYVNINVDFKKNIICVAGVDSDGTKYDLFKTVKCIIDGKIDFLKRGHINGVIFKDCLSRIKMVYNTLNNDVIYKSNNDVIQLEFEFMGHYNEPNIIIDLNQYIYSMPGEEFMLRLLYNPYDKQWNVSRNDECDDIKYNAENILQKQKGKPTKQKVDRDLKLNEHMCVINLYGIQEREYDDVFVDYCRVCSIPHEYCRYEETYFKCLCYCFKDNINQFKLEMMGLKKRDSKIWNQITPLVFIYCNYRIYDIGNDLIQLIVMFCGKYNSDLKRENDDEPIDAHAKGEQEIANDKKRIIVCLQKRKGNRNVTCIAGLLELNMKEKVAKKIFRQKFASAVSFNLIKGGKGKKECIIQGDVRYDFMKFMQSKYNVPAKMLFYKKKQDLYNACNEHGMVVLPP